MPANLRFCHFYIGCNLVKKLFNHKKHKGHNLCFLCLLWPFPVTVPLLNIARGSNVSYALFPSYSTNSTTSPTLPKTQSSKTMIVFNAWLSPLANEVMT